MMETRIANTPELGRTGGISNSDELRAVSAEAGDEMDIRVVLKKPSTFKDEIFFPRTKEETASLIEYLRTLATPEMVRATKSTRAELHEDHDMDMDEEELEDHTITSEQLESAQGHMGTSYSDIRRAEEFLAKMFGQDHVLLTSNGMEGRLNEDNQPVFEYHFPR